MAAREGNNVDDFHGEVLRNMTDQKTGAYGTIQIQIRTTRGLRPRAEHVLVYDQTEGNPDTKHCVYMMQLMGTSFLCLNSWGSKDPTPLVEVKRKGNSLYSVEANWTPVDIKTKESRVVSQSSESFGWSTQSVVIFVLVSVWFTNLGTISLGQPVANVILVSVTFLER